MSIDKFFSRTFSDRFVEFVDHVRRLISIGNHRLQTRERARQPVMEPQTRAVGAMLETSIPDNPEAWFIKLVEDCLRKYPDSIVLGQSPLADHVGVKCDSQSARGRQLQQLLHDAIESLRPTGDRPMGALPRVWFNYVVLHDAYVVGLRNRDVMARLYISEGTFNRTRRNAVRGVAMWLIERMRQKGNNN